MSVPAPVLDNRSYQDLVDEALARIPIHNPEWTNFNRSDPGVTLIELFAFLTESILYRANQIPERNRRKFLALLGVPLQPASSARGLVKLVNERGLAEPLTLHAGIEVRAGEVPFRTDSELDVLPVEDRAYYKRTLLNPSDELKGYYKHLFASYQGTKPDLNVFSLYETVPFAPTEPDGVDIVGETPDRSLWIALLLRDDVPVADPTAARDERDKMRKKLAGKTVNLGIVPVLSNPSAQLTPLGRTHTQSAAHLDFQLPRVPDGHSLGSDPYAREPLYRTLDARGSVNVLDEPGVVQLTLPGKEGLALWEDIDPLEAGVGDLPPALPDPKLEARVITWIRIQATTGTKAEILWAGINAVSVAQRAQIPNEVLPPGTGRSDQTVRLTRTPVIAETLRLTVDEGAGPVEWQRLDDLVEAGPEIPVPDLHLPPGAPQPKSAETRVYTLDPSSGLIRFGDGLRGRRPPLGAVIRANYSYGLGRAGNVGKGAIAAAPSLPAGLKASNPVRTWGGAEAESVTDGERQIARFLQHRDRVVSVEDFKTIACRTPGVDLGRVDVIPAFNPELAPSPPGDAAGAITLMLIPQYDVLNPQWPEPDQPFLDAICAYLDPRRLVTTEVFLRGPTYKPIWISVGIDIVPGESVAAVRDAVKAALLRFLAPLGDAGPCQDPAEVTRDAAFPHHATGWPRDKPVVALELLAAASKVPGVRLVRPVLIGTGDTGESETIEISGLELPRVVGLDVLSGDPLPLAQLRGVQPPTPAKGPRVVPVPTIPETC
jgi:hypothetical protein